MRSQHGASGELAKTAHAVFESADVDTDRRINAEEFYQFMCPNAEAVPPPVALIVTAAARPPALANRSLLMKAKTNRARLRHEKKVANNPTMVLPWADQAVRDRASAALRSDPVRVSSRVTRLPHGLPP